MADSEELSSPYFKTQKIFLRPCPPISQGLDNRLPPPPHPPPLLSEGLVPPLRTATVFTYLEIIKACISSAHLRRLSLHYKCCYFLSSIQALKLYLFTFTVNKIQI